MKSEESEQVMAEWRKGWPLVLAGIVGFGFYSVMIYSIGLFMQPIGDEFGWGRSQLSIGLSMASILSIPLSPIIGAMIDRWGSRRLAIPGLILISASISAFALTNGSTTQWIVLWLFYAVCSLGVKATMWIAAVTSVFSAGRGLALAVTMTGAAFAQIIVPPYAQWLIAEFGWRAAWVGLGLGWGIPALLLSVLFLFDAHDRNREQQRQVDPNTLAGLSVKEAARCKDLWLIAGSTILMMMLTVAVLVHQVPILTDVGLSREDAAWLASIGGIAGIAGKLATGWMMDRFSPHKIAGSTMAFAGLGFFFLLEPFRSVPVIIACMFVIGYSSGAKLQVTAFLTSRYAGTRNFGVIFGVMSSMITVGAGIGPTLAGAIYDGFGSYSPLLMAGVPGCALAGYCLFRLSPQPRFTASAVDHESDV